MNKLQKLIHVTLNDEIISNLSKELNVRVTHEELFLALIESCGVGIEGVAEIDWDYESIQEAYVRSHAFKLTVPVLDVVTLEERIIPYGTERSLFEELVRHKGEVWYIHKNDADPFPSTPHAHNYDANLTLHLGNGELYHGRKMVNKIKKKNLVKLRGNIKNIVLPKLDV